MRTDALIFMIASYVIIIGITGYFFYLALTIKPKEGSDSYSKNQDSSK